MDINSTEADYTEDIYDNIRDSTYTSEPIYLQLYFSERLKGRNVVDVEDQSKETATPTVKIQCCRFRQFCQLVRQRIIYVGLLVVIVLLSVGLIATTSLYIIEKGQQRQTNYSTKTTESTPGLTKSTKGEKQYTFGPTDSLPFSTTTTSPSPTVGGRSVMMEIPKGGKKDDSSDTLPFSNDMMSTTTSPLPTVSDSSIGTDNTKKMSDGEPMSYSPASNATNTIHINTLPGGKASPTPNSRITSTSSVTVTTTSTTTSVFPCSGKSLPCACSSQEAIHYPGNDVMRVLCLFVSLLFTNT